MSKFSDFFYTKKGLHVLYGIGAVLCAGLALEVYISVPKPQKGGVYENGKVVSYVAPKSSSDTTKYDTNYYNKYYKIAPDSDDATSSKTTTTKKAAAPLMVLNEKTGKKISNYSKYMANFRAKYEKDALQTAATGTSSDNSSDSNSSSAQSGYNPSQPVIHTKSIKIVQKFPNHTLALKLGNKYQLTAAVTPSNSTEPISWDCYSNNTGKESNVATISPTGLITAKKVGYANIVVRSDNTDDVCFIKVYTPVAVQSVSFTKKALTLQTCSKYQMTAKIMPSNATNKTLTWTTSNPNVVVVDKYGAVTPKKNGTATITATSVNKVHCSCTVKVMSTVKYVSKNTGTVPNNYFTYANYKKNCYDVTNKVGTTIFDINASAGSIAIDVDITGVQQYAGKALTVKLYKNGILDKVQSGYAGVVLKGNKTEGTGFSASTYMKNNLAWLTPTTYKVQFYAAGHPFSTVTVHVNEKGFCWAKIQ